MKLNYFYTLKALWDGQGKIQMYYEMARVKKQLSGKRSIAIFAQDVIRPWLLSSISEGPIYTPWYSNS